MEAISVERYAGFLDTISLHQITGWALDNDNASTRIELEFIADGKILGHTVCNEYREDLKQAGYGDGQYGFTHSFDPPLTNIPLAQFRIRIAGTDIHVKNSASQGPFRWGFAYIAADIVDNCNLRCPFCLVDYSKVRQTNKMTRETFTRLLELAPYVDDGNFLISCLHEPTLHPEFIDFLELIPESLRSKAIYTTNNCTKLGDDFMERLANTNLHHINISFDSLNSELFSTLRSGGKLPVFLENTSRMANTFRNSARAPKLRFIIMAFKSNMAEIPEMVRMCKQEFGTTEVEVRHTFDVRHISDEFRSRHFMTKDDWKSLEEKLYGDPGIFMYPPPEDYSPVPPIDYYMLEDNAGFPVPMDPPPLPLKLRVKWDGTIMVIGREKYFHLNINTARDPYATLISL